MKTIKLGTLTRDTANGLKVTPTMLHVISKDDIQRSVYVQPKGINPETKLPVDGYWSTEERIGGRIAGTVPSHLIGEEVEDIATGLKGKITAIIQHINGCLHVNILPTGVQKNGNKVDEYNVDIRRIKGKNIPSFTESELDQSEKENPSPLLYQKYTPKA